MASRMSFGEDLGLHGSSMTCSFQHVNRRTNEASNVLAKQGVGSDYMIILHFAFVASLYHFWEMSFLCIHYFSLVNGIYAHKK